jgi:hypothetical protein
MILEQKNFKGPSHMKEIVLKKFNIISRGSAVCFPPRGAAVRAPGVHPHFWNWDLLLAMYRYSLALR